MAVPDYQTLMLPVLEDVAKKATDAPSLINRISDLYNLSQDEREQLLPSKKDTTISNRVRWAATYLAKAGLLERPERGRLQITELGKKVIKSNPGKIDNNFLDQFEDFRIFRNKQDISNSNTQTTLQSSQTPEDLISNAYANLEQAVRDEILENITKSSPLFFERLILDLFKAMGYGSRGESAHVGKTGDGGIDGIINEDPLGLEKVYLQAKRYAPDNKISVDQIRSFAGSLDERGARKGIFVTTSSFATPAHDYAERSPKSLVLIDGDELTSLMYEYDVGVRTVQTIKIKKPDIDYFEDL